MWPTTFQERLRQWTDLRRHCQSRSLADGLQDINAWWMRSPWRPYYLHWDDMKFWPGPWDLLADNVFCDLARAAGIMYTVIMIEHPGVDRIEMVQTDQSNLVLVNDGKYILNWSADQLLNIASTELHILRRVDSGVLHHLTS